MKKIGILTYWGVANYGAWTQAYALNHVIRQICNPEDSVEHIAYLEKSHWNMYYEVDERLFNSFSYSWENIPHSLRYSESNIEDENFDVLIIGSDAVWEFRNPGFKDDMHMLGLGIHARQLFSYAASFGALSIQHFTSEMKNALYKFEKISVRDRYSENIIVKATEGRINPEVVVDPALLWDFRSDRQVVYPVYENYIAVYGATFDEDFIKNSIRFAKKNNLKLISIGYVNSWCDMSLKMIELRGLEWIGMIASAAYVFTSTFHGLMVSINFRKQVKFNQVAYVKNRSQTLIEELNIPDHSKNFDLEVDYTVCEERLKKMQSISLEYIKSILK